MFYFQSAGYRFEFEVLSWCVCLRLFQCLFRLRSNRYLKARMTIFKIAKQSLIHFWRSNLAIALGVAAATAVLTGALIVGDSMRSSLRNLTLDRLGRIDEMLVSDGFFRSELAAELSQSDTFKENYSAAVPAILFPNGTVEFEASLPDNDRWVSRASNVNVIGVSCLLYTSPSPRDATLSRMPSSA